MASSGRGIAPPPPPGGGKGGFATKPSGFASKPGGGAAVAAATPSPPATPSVDSPPKPSKPTDLVAAASPEADAPPPPPAKPKTAKELKAEEAARVKQEKLEAAQREKQEKLDAAQREKDEKAAKLQAAKDEKVRRKSEAADLKQRRKSEAAQAKLDRKRPAGAPPPQAGPPPPPPGPPPGRAGGGAQVVQVESSWSDGPGKPEKGKKPAAAGPPPAASSSPAGPPPKPAKPPPEAIKRLDGTAATFPLPPPPGGKPPKRKKSQTVGLVARFNYTAQADDELSLTKGMKLYGFELVENDAWWYGEYALKDRRKKQQTRGLFPAEFVEIVDPKLRKQLAKPKPAEAEGRGGGRGGAPAAAGGAPAGAKPPDASKLRLTLYAHNLAYGGSFLAIVMGLFSALWWSEGTRAGASDLKRQSLFSVIYIWIYSIALGVCVYCFEYLFGLKRMKSESAMVSPRGWAYTALSIPLWVGFPTMLAAGVLLTCGIVNIMADYYREEGDASHVKGNYGIMWFEKDEDAANKAPVSEGDELTWVERAREKGTLTQNVVVTVYVLLNVLLMTEACIRWNIAISRVLGTCIPSQSTCPGCCPSRYAPFAKMGGQMLNFNCSVLVIPVLKSLLRWANNYEISPTKSLAQYIPLRKNIIFHKLIASFVALGVLIHVVMHFINFAYAPEYTLYAFGPISWVTGSLATYAMFVIYSGAQNRVKRASYEIFWTSHHFLVLFFISLLVHGPDFWAWSCLPVLAYVTEKVLRLRRGSTKFFLRRVLFIPPVMELSFFPENNADFKFKEGQYLYVLAPHISDQEWHPFTISSAHEDLTTEREITLHIRVQGPKSWTRKLNEYFALMTHSTKKKGEAFLLELEHYDSNGVRQGGKHLGPDGKPIIAIDGPHAAPAQHYSEYSEVMLCGAGIGLTPCTSILKAILRHKWKLGWAPSTLYFYWIVRHDELESFRWFVSVLEELEKRLASDRHAGAIDSMRQYVELNVFVTAAPKQGATEPRKLDLDYSSAHDQKVGFNVDVGFDEASLMRGLLNPTLRSDKFRETQGSLKPGERINGRFLDIWVWNGRPPWAQIFQCVKEQRAPETKAIAVAFCGTPVIGKDLKKLCVANSSLKEKISFVLLKENF